MIPNYKYIKTMINIKQGLYQTKKTLMNFKNLWILQLTLSLKLKLIIFSRVY